MRLVIGVALLALACTSKKTSGETCTVDSECDTDHCTVSADCGRVCTCERDSDCALGQQCVPTTDCGAQCTGLATILDDDR